MYGFFMGKENYNIREVKGFLELRYSIKNNV